MAYTDLTEVRALPGLEDYPDDLLLDSIARAEELITDYCGPWAPTVITKRLQGGTGSVIHAGIPAIQTITSAKFDGVAQDVSEWKADFFGDIILPASVSDVLTVEVTVTAAIQDAAPERLKWAARTLAAAYVTEHDSATPERALAVQSEFGQIQLAQAGGKPDRPTAYPDVNAVLNRFRSGPVVA